MGDISKLIWGCIKIIGSIKQWSNHRHNLGGGTLKYEIKKILNPNLKFIVLYYKNKFTKLFINLKGNSTAVSSNLGAVTKGSS